MTISTLSNSIDENNLLVLLVVMVVDPKVRNTATTNVYVHIHDRYRTCHLPCCACPIKVTAKKNGRMQTILKAIIHLQLFFTVIIYVYVALIITSL